ncbi:MAG: pyruvate dehydrogenase (acetyl-transferring) E1 component subunit alpha [Rhodospirillales bacterium]
MTPELQHRGPRIGGQSPGDVTVASFTVRYRRFIDQTGRVVGELPPVANDRDALIKLYRAMVLVRTFDARAVALQRTGQLGTYASCLGQEAVGIGVASAMREDDVLLPSYRDQAAQLWRGVTMTELLLYWSGDERGSDFAGPRWDFPISVPVASQALHAAGVAAAFKLRRQRRASVCLLGDGATSKGDFYEALNLAGLWRLPVVFVVSNNGWAISVPTRRQTAAETLAQKAIAAGIPGEQVDGNDVVAVHQAADEAIARARAGGGAAVIEALTYRLGDHTTADDASRYRDEAEVSIHWPTNPLNRLRAYLAARGWWRKDEEEALLADCKARVEAAKDAYLATAPARPESIFEHLYETLPEQMTGQKDWLAKGGGDA